MITVAVAERGEGADLTAVMMIGDGITTAAIIIGIITAARRLAE